MDTCEYCGDNVKNAPVYHTDCWMLRVQKLMDGFCADKCVYYGEVGISNDATERCCDCALIKFVTEGAGFDALERELLSITLATNRSIARRRQLALGAG